MLEELVHVVDLVVLCVCWLLCVVVSFDCRVFDVMICFGVFGGDMVFSGGRLVFLLGVLDHVLDGVLQPRSPVDGFLVVGLMVLRSLVLGLRVGLRVGLCCLVFHAIVDNADPRFEGSTRCSIRCVRLLGGNVHGVAVHPFHGEVLAVHALLHS